jgi:dipeptidyl aminopeptidase/acylaminoacyl peptidase
MISIRLLCAALVSLALVLPLGLRSQISPHAPASATSDSSPRRFALDDLWSLVNLTDIEISKDGRTVAVVTSRANPAANRYDHALFAIDAFTGSARILFEGHGVASPRWCPTGQLAFLAHDDATSAPQVFVLPPSGPARALTNFSGGVERFAWSPFGDQIALIAPNAPAPREGLDRLNDAFEVGHDNYLTTHAPAPLHLWLVPASGGTPRRLTSAPGSLGTEGMGSSPITWAPDGRTIVVMRTISAHSGDADQSHLEVIDVATGAVQPLTNRTAFETSPAISPDGRSVSFLFPRDGDPASAIDARIVPITGGNDEPVAASLDRSILWNQWLPDGTLLLGANDATRMAIWKVEPHGEPSKLDTASLAEITDVSVASDGTIALLAAEPARPAEVYLLSSRTPGPPHRLTDFNAAATQFALGRTEPLDWTSEDKVHADGVVTFPPDFSPTHKWPLVLIIHGGPTGSSNESFDPLAQLMAARGWIVFQPNYRGSDNLGSAFQRGIVPGAGSGPGRDIMSGVAALKARGYIDESRIAVSGWSYGGFMTAWMIGHYSGWRVAVAGAAAMDLSDMYALSDLNVMRRHAITGSPWTGNRELAFRDESPLTNAASIRTPTLLLSNTGDTRVAVTQTYKLFRALEDNHVETQFIAYPTAGHLPAGPIRRRDVYRRWIEWIDQHFQKAQSVGKR